MSVPKCLFFFQDLEGLTEVFGRMSAGISGQKLLLWAEFSFLNSEVPEGHHPRGTTLREALRGNLPLRGLCGGLSEGSAGSLRGFCGVSAGFCGGPRDFPAFPGVVTLPRGPKD